MPDGANGPVDRGLVELAALGFPTRWAGGLLPFAFEGFGQPLLQQQAILLWELLNPLENVLDRGLTHGSTKGVIITV
jgi:hypothetical protein